MISTRSLAIHGTNWRDLVAKYIKEASSALFASIGNWLRNNNGTLACLWLYKYLCCRSIMLVFLYVRRRRKGRVDARHWLESLTQPTAVLCTVDCFTVENSTSFLLLQNLFFPGSCTNIHSFMLASTRINIRTRAKKEINFIIFHLCRL